MPLAQGFTVQECLKEEPSLWKAYQCLVDTFPGNRLPPTPKTADEACSRLQHWEGADMRLGSCPSASRLESNVSATHQGTVWHSISAQGLLCGSSEKCCPRQGHGGWG